jgi:hypothetical protein
MNGRRNSDAGGVFLRLCRGVAIAAFALGGAAFGLVAAGLCMVTWAPIFTPSGPTARVEALFALFIGAVHAFLAVACGVVCGHLARSWRDPG